VNTLDTKIEEQRAIYRKKIEVELENSIETIPSLIEPLLQNYKGAELRFQEKEKELSLDFDIGSGENQFNIAISLTPDSPGKTIMVLQVAAVEDPKVLRIPDKIIRKIDILIKDVLFHIISKLNIKNKAKILEKGRVCPSCTKLNDFDAKFCKECSFDFQKALQPKPPVPQKPSLPRKPIVGVASSAESTPIKPKEVSVKPSLTDEEIIEQLDRKYVLKYECSLCENSCQYRNPFILLLKDVKNLRESFEKFDEFLHDKDIDRFSDYIYEFAAKQMKKYPKFSPNELQPISYCIFSILSFHILEKASKSVRLTFAEKMKERLKARFRKDFPSSDLEELAAVDLDIATPTIKTGTLHIEENRCPNCYRKFDERTLKLKIKGYTVLCPNCDYEI